MTAIITGSFFIIPNHASIDAEDEFLPDYVKRARDTELANVGIMCDADEMVEVWYLSPGCDNWRSHKWGENPEFFGMGGIPSRLPKALLENIKEGDVLTLQWVGAGEPRTIELRAAQLEYRYAFGRFEEVLKRVCR